MLWSFAELLERLGKHDTVTRETRVGELFVCGKTRSAYELQLHPDMTSTEERKPSRRRTKEPSSCLGDVGRDHDWGGRTCETCREEYGLCE